MQGNTLGALCANRNPESSRCLGVPRYLNVSAAHFADVRCVTLGFDILLPFLLARGKGKNSTHTTEIVLCYER
jgi:hypothetical protein